MIRIESPKNIVEINGTSVRKRYRPGFNGAKRFRREVEALGRLAGIDGIPVVLEFADEPMMLVVSRIAGTPLADCATVLESVMHRLRGLVEEMMRRGVARHSMPARDVMVRPDAQVGMVDFERVTLRGWRFSPPWLIACAVMRFHLLRLIADRAPELLTARERRRLAVQWQIRNLFRYLIEARRSLRGQKPGLVRDSRES
ncbi:MAG: hypothetical protein ACREIA_16585 [Opitutaceae bacterium]